MTRMRGIKAAVDYLKAQDPETAVTEFWLRCLLKTGAVPYHRAGKRFLVNIDALELYLANPPVKAEEAEEVIQHNIRRVACR
jgi:hypothetical protein